MGPSSLRSPGSAGRCLSVGAPLHNAENAPWFVPVDPAGPGWHTAATPGSPPIPPALPPLTLVLGGARSGKSAFAEGLVLGSGLEPVYVATAQALDGEMRARVDHHRRQRGDRWRLVEEPLELAEALRENAAPGRAVVVDCLTLWLTNVLLAGRDPAAEGDRLLRALAALPGPVVLVSNEVGQGVVPANALARRFVDEAGRLHQCLAAAAGEVVLVTAGLPLRLKGDAHPRAGP